MERALRAALYVRVSTEEQREGTSLDVQRDLCASYIASRGWVEVGRYADEGISGTSGSRPALNELVAACRRLEIDAVVVSRLDRFGRSLRALSLTLGELDDLGVQFVSVHEAFDSLGPAGRLQRNILSSVAQFEREQMMARSISGLRALAAAGWWPGGPAPFGFRLERVGRHLKLVIDEVEANTLRRAADLIVDRGLSPRQCAAVLNSEGLPPRRTATWSYSNLRSHLLGSALSGTWRYGRGRNRRDGAVHGVVQVEIPAILTPERHLALLERLQRTTRGPQNPDHASYFVLSRGILRCECGAICTGEGNYESGRRTYSCVRRRNGPEPRCPSPRIHATSIDEHVIAVVAAILRTASADPTEPLDTKIPDRLEVLGARLHDAEVAVGHVAIALLGLDLSADAMTEIVGEISGGLATVRHEKERLEAQLADIAEDPARRVRLRDIAASLQRPLVELKPWQQRPVLELLDVHVQINHWAMCGLCRGRRRVATGTGGVICPSCNGVGQLPVVTVSGMWIPER